MATRGFTFSVDIDLVTEECITCGMAFAVPSNVIAWRKKDHQNFYCPAGHAQIFSAESNEERLKRELKEAEIRHASALAEEARRRLRAEESAMDLARSNAALKGQATKLKKRVTAGVCTFCNRQFQNVRAHMTGQHPSQCANDGTPVTTAEQEAITKRRRSRAELPAPAAPEG